MVRLIEGLIHWYVYKSKCVCIMFAVEHGVTYWGPSQFIFMQMFKDTIIIRYCAQHDISVYGVAHIFLCRRE